MRRTLAYSLALLVGLSPATAAAQQSVPGRNQILRLDGTASRPSDSYERDNDLGRYRIGPNNEGNTANSILQWDWDTTRIKLRSGYTLDWNTTSIDATDVGYIDGLTPGTVTASKGVVVDANKDIATFRHVTISGNFVTGSTTLSETDLAKIDAITNGTGAANKALVLDANADITAGIRHLSLTGNLVAAGAGPHAIGGVTSNAVQVFIYGALTTSSDTGRSLFVTPTLTLEAGRSGTMLETAGTLVEAASGTHALLSGVRITAPIVTAGAAAVTDTATLSVSGAISATVSGKNYGIWGVGDVRFDGDEYISGELVGHSGGAARTRLDLASDGVPRFTNAAGTGFGRVLLGPSNTSFISLKPLSGVLEVRLADDSAYAPLVASELAVDGTSPLGAAVVFKTSSSTVASIYWSYTESKLKIDGISTSVRIAPSIRLGGGNVDLLTGSGTPEAAVTATVGSLFLRSDGGAGSSFYVKESGSGNTGWVAK